MLNLSVEEKEKLEGVLAGIEDLFGKYFHQVPSDISPAAHCESCGGACKGCDSGCSGGCKGAKGIEGFGEMLDFEGLVMAAKDPKGLGRLVFSNEVVAQILLNKGWKE